MIQVSYVEEGNYFRVKRHGLIQADDIVKYVKEIDSMLDSASEIRVLDDARDALTAIQPGGDLERILASVKSLIGRHKSVRIAVLARDPMITAMTILYQGMANAVENYSIQVFSTEDVATSWLFAQSV